MKMKIVTFVFIVILFQACNSAKFNIISKSTCSNTSAAGFCLKWEQNGTVEEQVASCFSSEMVVLTKEHGYKYMNELEIGDEILTFDRQYGEIYTKVRGWFHKDVEAHVKFLQMTFKNRESMIVSEKHNIALTNQEDFEYLFAKDLRQGFKKSLQSSKIQSIQPIYLQGMYAPMTQQSNYFVFTSKSSNKQRILAHDYANIRNPQSFQMISNLIIDGYEMFSSIQEGYKIHPAAEFMMKSFGFLTE